MTETQFDNGYWYADEIKALAKEISIPSAYQYPLSNWVSCWFCGFAVSSKHLANSRALVVESAGLVVEDA